MLMNLVIEMQCCGSESGSAGSAGSSSILVEAEAEAEAPESMPLPLPLCFKTAVQILVDFCKLEVISFRFCLIFI
jgi:hypothetical protein